MLLSRAKPKPGSAERNLRQVAHEDALQVHHQRAVGRFGENRQAVEHAVGVRQLHGAIGGAVFLRLEPHVAADDLHPFARLAELPHPVVAKTPTEPTVQRFLANATGDGDEHDKIAIQITRLEFCEERHIALMQFQQTVNRLGVFQHFGHRRILGLFRRSSGRLRLGGLFRLGLHNVRLRRLRLLLGSGRSG